MEASLTPELRALASASFKHQAAGRFVEAAQGYLAVLSRVPDLWSACYNLGLVYQHLGRMPEAADMYLRAVRLNPRFAEAYNNLGNVLKALKKDAAAIDAYQRAINLNPQLSDASYNLAIMSQARGEHTPAIELFRQAVAANPWHGAAWDALYRGLLGLKRHEEAIDVFLAWDRAMPPSPELVAAGLALCRPIGDHVLEARYLALALNWPFDVFAPEQFAPILGMIQYFDITREQLLACYRRYDAAVDARRPLLIPLLPRRAADSRLRIGYMSADFRRHVMGRWMLEIISRHDRSRVSVFLISTCPSGEHDAITAAFRTHVDGFADISEMDDFAAAKSVAEVDLDILVDLAGHTMAARPGIYAHRPARTIVTHLGYHGCLGLSAVEYKLTDRIADPIDAARFQIERPFALDGCVFPLVRVAPVAADPAAVEKSALDGKFIFAAFTNVLKLSTRCLAIWRHVLEALPEAVLLFSPASPAQQSGYLRCTAAAGIDSARVAFLDMPGTDPLSRSRYKRAHAVLDTFPYGGGDTTLAALDMGVPVVTLLGERHSERVGASILTHLGLTDTIAKNAHEFVAIAVKLARDATFMAQTRQRIQAALATTDVAAYTRTLEHAFAEIASRKPVDKSMTLTARQFFHSLREAVQRHRSASDDQTLHAVAATYAALRTEQPDYSPLLRVQGELAQTLGNRPLATECASVLLQQFPGDLDARLSSAGFLIDDGAPAEALSLLPPVADEGESDVRVLKLYVRAHAKLGQWQTALSYSVAAVARAPAEVQVLFWHGLVLSHTADAESALTYLNRALILAPNYVEAAYNAGVILGELGNSGDAETVFRRAVAGAKGREAVTAGMSAHLRLLQLLWSQGRIDEWISEGQRFANAYPHAEMSSLIESRIARYRGELEREADILLPLAEMATALKNDVTALALIGELLATLSYHDVPAPLLERLTVRFSDAARVLYSPLETPFPAPVDTHWQVGLRLGYLVDFSQPFVADFIATMLSHHDPNRVTAKVYAISPVDPALSAYFLAQGWQLISVATFDEARAARTIQADKLDILVDVAAFGPYAKPGLYSCRPARVQLAFPGFTHPAGIGELDYRLTDKVADIDTSAESFTAAPILSAGCVFPLLPASPAGEQLTRLHLDMADDVPVFGVLAAAARLSSRCLTTWKALHDRLPTALFFVCPLAEADRAPIKRMLVAAGIAVTHIVMLPASHRRPRDLSLTGVVDVILDTMPGSDYFSTRAAIFDSIPIVAMSGRMAGERVALSLLSHLGDASTVVASGRDYVDLAAQLATDPKARAARADRLRSLLLSSSLGDMNQYVQRIEDALFSAVAATPDRMAQAT